MHTLKDSVDSFCIRGSIDSRESACVSSMETTEEKKLFLWLDSIGLDTGGGEGAKQRTLRFLF